MAHSLTSTYTAGSPGSNRSELDSEELKQAKIDLAACFRMAARHGLEEGICNHFSAVVPGCDDLFIVNPYGYAFRELTASMMLVCDFDGNVLDGDGKPEATAFYIHAQIHKAIPRAKVAFHTHMPYATALAMVEGEPLAFAGQTSLKFYGRTTVDSNYRGLALDSAEGARIAASAGDADIIFMRQHGVMVLAPTIAQAWDDLYYLERACQVQCIAMSTGRKIIPIDSEMARATACQMQSDDAESARLHLDSIKRTLDLEEPNYRT